MKVIKVSFDERDLEALDRQAQQRKISRAELIRERTFTTVSGKKFTPQDFSTLVADAYRRNHGAIDRRQVESIVAFVFARMAGGAPSGVEASPSPQAS